MATVELKQDVRRNIDEQKKETLSLSLTPFSARLTAFRANTQDQIGIAMLFILFVVILPNFIPYPTLNSHTFCSSNPLSGLVQTET